MAEGTGQENEHQQRHGAAKQARAGALQASDASRFKMPISLHMSGLEDPVSFPAVAPPASLKIKFKTSTPPIEVQTPRKTKRKRQTEKPSDDQMPNLKLPKPRRKSPGRSDVDQITQSLFVDQIVEDDDALMKAKKVYCEIQSIEILEERLRKHEPVTCMERNLFNPSGYLTKHSIYDLNKNDTITLERREAGSGKPRAYEWLLWDGSGIIVDK